MAYTEADLARVRAQMQEAEAVSYGDRSLKRRSLAELRQLEKDILHELTPGTRTQSKQLLVSTSKGL